MSLSVQISVPTNQDALSENTRGASRAKPEKRDPMFTRILMTGSVLAALSCWTLAASAETVRKPTVCVDFKTFENGKALVGVCFDGKRKRVFSTWSTVRLANAEGKQVSYTVGF